MDLLSSLPNDVRVHILSFLTTKEAALTSILSKKWRNLFALVPNLVLDDSVFLNPEEGKRERVGILRSFMDFVDRVLALQGNSPIKKFSIKCKAGVCPNAVNRWICRVLDRAVTELDLCLDFGEEYYLPRELFVSSSLVKLGLKSVFGVNWWIGSEETFLPMLKRLEIESERIVCDGKVEMLLPCFPVLEELHMSYIEWVDRDVTVSSVTVKELCINAAGLDFQNLKSISFDTPNLLSFGYSDFVAEDYPLVSMEKLVVAKIALILTPPQIKRLRAPNNESLEDDVVLRFGNVVKLMNGIQNVERLRLHYDTLEVLSLCCESMMPMFNNLRLLLITSDKDRGWQAMPVLLRNSPHLEVLVIEGLVHHVTDRCGDACDCVYRKEKGRSLRSCPVKMIVIHGFRGTMKEMNMIEHFLDYFPCLKKMQIFIEENGDTELSYDPEVCLLVMGMIQEFNEMYSCHVKLLMSDNLCKTWRTQGLGSFLSSLLGKIC